MTYNIVIENKAFADIDSIVKYLIDNFNKSSATNLLNEIEKQLISLANFPFMGKRLIISKKLKNEYRCLIIKNYILFYTIKEDLKTISITRILHGMQDYSNLLD